MTVTTVPQKPRSPLTTRKIPVLQSRHKHEYHCLSPSPQIQAQLSFFISLLGARCCFATNNLLISDGRNDFYRWKEGDPGILFGVTFNGKDHFLTIIVGSSFDDQSAVYDISLSEAAETVVFFDANNIEIDLSSLALFR